MRRKVWLFFVCGLVLPLVFAASASAQGSTLLVTNQTPTPGEVITVTGTNFTAAAGNSPVTIRLNTRNGTVLASPTPDSAGRISATFPIPPSLAPGWYLLIATQTSTANGRMRAFTPGRARIRIRAPGTPRAAAPPGGEGGWPSLPLGLGALGLAALLGAGGTLAARRLRTEPQLSGSPR